MVLGLKKPANLPGSAAPAIIIGVFIAFGGLLFGYDTGTISGILAMPYWLRTFSTMPPQVDAVTGQQVYSITASQTAEIVSLLSAGNFFGALMSAPLADFMGRKLGLVASTGVFTVGVILQTAADAIPLFVAGRFLAGLGVGLLSAIVPLYQSETAPKWIRGSIVGCYQLAITIGIFLAAIVNYGTGQRDDSGSYRIPIALQFLWAIILVGGMLFLPETPRYYIKKNKPERAAKSLSKLRRLDVANPALTDELAEIQANHDYEMELGKASYFDIFKGTLGKRLATGCLLQALQQLTGVNFIFYYGTIFFSAGGFGNPFIITVVTDIVNVLSTLPGLYAVEAFGRRSTLFVGAIGMFCAQLIVAILGTIYFKVDTDPASANYGKPYSTSLAASKALIAFVCVYIFFFASTWGPNAWVVTGEIFPLKARAKCLSLSTASNWLLNWAIGYATPYLVNYGPGDANLQAKVFWIWCFFCLVCAFFVWGLIYETKGLSLEQIDEMYAKVPHAWQSSSFVPTVNWADVQEVTDAGTARHKSLADIEIDTQRKKSVAVPHDEKNEKVL